MPIFTIFAQHLFHGTGKFWYFQIITGERFKLTKSRIKNVLFPLRPPSFRVKREKKSREKKWNFLPSLIHNSNSSDFENEKLLPSRLIERKHRTHCIVRLAFNPFLRFRINRRVNTELSTRVMKLPVYWYAYQLRGKSRSNFSLPHCLRRQAGFNFLLSSPFSNRASFQGAIPAFPPSFLSSFSPLFFFLLEKKSEEEDCRTRRKSKVGQHIHTHFRVLLVNGVAGQHVREHSTVSFVQRTFKRWDVEEKFPVEIYIFLYFLQGRNKLFLPNIDTCAKRSWTHVDP